MKWDLLGYAHLTKLASERQEEAYVQRTSSTEYWDEAVPHEKIKYMSKYLEDVCAYLPVSRTHIR